MQIIKEKERDSSASGEIDLSLYMSARKIKGLSEDQKTKLRAVVRRHQMQSHFMHFKWGGASGALVETNEEAERRANTMRDLRRPLPGYADPIPSQGEFYDGIEHYNDNPPKQGSQVGRRAGAAVLKDALLRAD